MTHYRRAAGEAGKRAALVLLAAGLVVMIGLVVFANPEHLPRWLWRIEVQQQVSEILDQS